VLGIGKIYIQQDGGRVSIIAKFNSRAQQEETYCGLRTRQTWMNLSPIREEKELGHFRLALV
jgi:hypothetical protein